MNQNNVNLNSVIEKLLDSNYLVYYSESLDNYKDIPKYISNKKLIELRTKNG